ncbi:General odorant-binding protein 19d [Pseudolycoriella hygida]|uniref:General odorant-binding protein 19d n=1 Tax=Pseudolycoriella hygida TaxID=35572 RepID=A0A9Q0MYA8_9DIPT|nr:General odorant-binding protein 19d [Pseudolycoriella hygida]
MNILLKLVFLVYVFQASAKPLTPEESQAMFVDILTNCKAAEGASEDDALGIITHSVPKTKTESCLHACVMEKTGVVANGKFSMEGALQLAGMSGDPQKPKNVAVIGADCVSLDVVDRCELGQKIMACLHKGAATIGIYPATDMM